MRADDYRGLGALARGLLGDEIQKRYAQDILQQYTAALMSGGTVVIDTELDDIIVGDCVVVEKDRYANIRCVAKINCQAKQQPEHHVQAA